MLDARDPNCLWADGRVQSLFGRHAVAISRVEEAVDLNPSSAMAHHTLGFVLGRAGRAEEALPHIERAMALSPRDIYFAGFLALGSVMMFNLGRYQDAFAWAQRAVHSPSPRRQSFSILVASLIKLGKPEEAAIALADQEMQARGSSLSENKNYFDLNFPNNSESVDHLIEALREAGVPE